MNKKINAIFVLAVLSISFSALFLFPSSQRTVQAAVICNNGPSNSDSGGCGDACGCGSAWSKNRIGRDVQGDFCKSYGVEPWYFIKIGDICSTGDKCVSGDKGLRPGYCDCGSSGPLYKSCCQGSTAVNCINYGVQDNYPPPEGTCPSGSSIVYGTSCPSSPPPAGRTCGEMGGTVCIHDGSNCPSGLCDYGPSGDSWPCTSCCGSCGGGTTPPPAATPTPGGGGGGGGGGQIIMCAAPPAKMTLMEKIKNFFPHFLKNKVNLLSYQKIFKGK